MSSDLVARMGRHQQLYEDGHRLFAGCIPYRYRDVDEASRGKPEKIVEVLMITSPSGPGLLFPKGEWENDETVGEAAKREAVEEAGVRGELKVRIFPRGLTIGYYYFKNKTQQDEFSPEGSCKAAVFALLVKEELDSWPEQNMRDRIWLPLDEGKEKFRHAWMRDAIVNGFSKWVQKVSGQDG